MMPSARLPISEGSNRLCRRRPGMTNYIASSPDRRPFVDLAGSRFGDLLVVERVYDADNGKRKRVRYLCRCNCGTEKIMRVEVLRKSKSCGCRKDEARVKGGASRRIDITGQRFSKLTALNRVGVSSSGPSIWFCRCDCGNSCEVKVSELRGGIVRSCGCLRAEVIRELRSGANSNLWNPNLTDEERILKRSIPGHDEFRKFVLDRDDYTCALCEKRGGSLAVHHLDGWNWCIEGRLEPDNAVTLCKPCHKNFHDEYGRRDNTQDQFEQYARQKGLA